MKTFCLVCVRWLPFGVDYPVEVGMLGKITDVWTTSVRCPCLVAE